MPWPKGKYGDHFGGWGNTQEEAWANQRKAEQESGTAGGYEPITVEWLEAVEKAFPRPKPKRPRPDGVLTKTEQKRKLAQEKARAKLDASLAKYGDEMEAMIAAAAKKAGQPLS
jgi:hypothetical protein